MRSTLLACACLLTAILAAAPVGASPPPGYDPKSCRFAIETHGIDAHCTVKGMTVGGYVDCNTNCDFTGHEWSCFFSTGGPVDYFQCPVADLLPDAYCVLTPTSAGLFGACTIAGSTLPILVGCESCVPLWVGPTCTLGLKDGTPVAVCA
ncbi:MAG: hypothetical protein QOD77_776 [Thermoplasmata archaeon]|jgi:hypothetical protein|nr:hypothetical protein [Thermoplasmata archaeon]